MMNKADFLKGFAPKKETVEIDGKPVEITELTLQQRGKLHEAAKGDPIRGQGLIVCMGCTLFDESDIDAVMGMSGDVVTAIADSILALSGLSDEDAKKN